MNRRDTALLDALLLKLTAHFNDPERRSIAISRGEGRAIVAAIRERNGLRAVEVETAEEKGELL